MKVGFVFTNYNNSAFTRQAIASLAHGGAWEDCHVVVVDNSSASDEVAYLHRIGQEFPAVTLIFNEENVGYFRGLNVGIRYLRGQTVGLEHIVVGNNDLVFPPDFMGCLHGIAPALEAYAVISPDLLTLDGVHQNPHVLTGISRTRELIWDVYYSNYALARAIKWAAGATRKLTRRKDYQHHRHARTIYMGYGACYILGPAFFRHFSELWAPTFLMGEEFFLSWQVHERGQEIYYDPAVLVNHHDHATLNKVPSRKLWEIARDSHRIRRRYVKTGLFSGDGRAQRDGAPG